MLDNNRTNECSIDQMKESDDDELRSTIGLLYCFRYEGKMKGVDVFNGYGESVPA